MGKISNRILPLLLLFTLLSCSYEPDRASSRTGFKFEFDGLMGTQVTISATPDDYTSTFYYDVIKVSSYDELIASGMTNHEIAQSFVMEKRKAYETWLDGIEGRENYHSSWMDVWYIGPGHSRLFVNLEPLTDYYVYVICIKPGTDEPLGDMQLCPFTTTEIQTEARPILLDFMIWDSEDGFTYYVRPTYKGRICKDLYLTAFVSHDELYGPPYNGDLFLYTRDWYYRRKDFIGRYIRSDIARIEVAEDMIPGKSYTLIAAPFNIGDEVPISSVSFEYEPGMKTDGYIPGRLMVIQ